MASNEDESPAPADSDVAFYESPHMIRTLSVLNSMVSFTPTGDQAKDCYNLRELKRGIAEHMPNVFSTTSNYPAAQKAKIAKVLLKTLRTLCGGEARAIAQHASDGFTALEELEAAFDRTDTPSLLHSIYNITIDQYPTAIQQISRIKELTMMLEASGHPMPDDTVIQVLKIVMRFSPYATVQALLANFEATPPDKAKDALQQYQRVASAAELNAPKKHSPTDDMSLLTSPAALVAHAKPTVDEAYKLMCSRCTGRGHLVDTCDSPQGLVDCALCNRPRHTYETCRQQQNLIKPYVLGGFRSWPRRFQEDIPPRNPPRGPVARQALCVTAEPPGQAYLTGTQHGHDPFMIVDSGCTHSTSPANVTPTSRIVPTPLYDAGGNVHRATHQGILYAQTRDGRIELDITARQTPTIPHDLMSVSYLVDERDAQVVFASPARGGSYIQPRHGERIPITRRGRQFVLEYDLRRPPSDAQPTPRGKTDLAYPQPSTADQDGPGFSSQTWATSVLVLAVSVGAGPTAAASPGHTARLAPGLPRDSSTLHLMFGHASATRVKSTCVQYGIKPDDKAPVRCDACTIANLPKAETSGVSRTPLDHANIDMWEMDLSYQFGNYALDAIHVKSSTLIFMPLKHKSDVAGILPTLIARIRDAGGEITHIRTDLGGEFTAHNVEPTLALLGVSLTYVTPELHVNRAEAAHKLANRAMRANLATAPDLLNFWMYARTHGVAAHNSMVTARHNDIPMRVLTGHLPSIQPLMPWASQVAVLVHPTPNSSSCRAVLATYLGPAQKCGNRAIYYTTDNTHVAHSTSYRYLAPPSHRLPPSAYLPAQQPSPVYYALTDPEVARTASPHELARTSTSTTSFMLFDPVDATLLRDYEFFYPTVPDAPNASQGWSTPNVANLPSYVLSSQQITPDVHTSDEIPAPLAPVLTTMSTSPTMGPSTPNVPNESSHVSSSQQVTQDGLQQSEPMFMNDYDSLAYDHDTHHVPLPSAPYSLKAALTGRDSELWLAATRKQMDAFSRHNTMEPIAKSDAPAHMALYPLGSTVVYKRDGTPKVRIHVNGSSINRDRVNDPAPGPYEASNDHYRSSSPTASYDSLKLQVAHAANTGQALLQADINDFYILHPNEQAYLARFPSGLDTYYDLIYDGRSPFSSKTHYMLVRGNLWGHPDAGRIAHELLCQVIRALGFVPSPMDVAFYVMPRSSPHTTATLCLIVDDIVVGSDESHAHFIMDEIAKHYQTKGTHPVSDICNINITRLPDGYSIDQTEYVHRLLRRHGYDALPASTTPLETHFHAGPEDDQPQSGRNLPEFDNPRVIIGELGFLRITRPDIVHAISILSTALTCWTPKHSRNLARVLRYLKHKPSFPLVFRRSQLPLQIQDAYADCSFASELHHGTNGRAKSRSGILIRILNVPFIAVSVRQTATAMSTSEGELAALCLCARKIIPLKLTIDMLNNLAHPTPPIVISTRTTELSLILFVAVS